MIVYERAELDTAAGVDRLKKHRHDNVIELAPLRNSADQEEYDRFLNQLNQKFDGVDEFTPVDIDLLFNQSLIAITLIFNSEDRLYKKMIEFSDKIEPFLTEDYYSLSHGLAFALVQQYTGREIVADVKTGWADRLLIDSLPKTYEMVKNAVLEDRIIERSEWMETLSKELPDIGTNPTTFIQIAYLSLIGLIEQSQLSNGEIDTDVRIEYGPTDRFNEDVNFLSYGSILLADITSPSFPISADETPLQIIERLYKEKDVYYDAYLAARHIIFAITPFFEDQFSYFATHPIGKDRVNLYEDIPELRKAITTLFVTYVEDMINEKDSEIQLLSKQISDGPDFEAIISKNENEIDYLKVERFKLSEKLTNKDKEVVRLNKVIGKLQADQLRIDDLKSQNDELAKQVKDLEKQLKESE